MSVDPLRPSTPLPVPELGNQYDDDRVLRSYLRRVLPSSVLAEIEPELREMGELAGGELYRLQLADRLNEPVWTPWSPWGERIDAIEPTPLWRRAERLAAQFGLVAAAYERRHGRFSRLHPFALVHLFAPSTDVYACPLAMTDGAARTLTDAGNERLAARALPHLLSRDPAEFWTSGQWMTETAGGSDVGGSETVARREGGDWRLFGRKWFTSAVSAQMALTLARPEGNPPGGRGLALFYLETRDAAGRPNGLEIARLKDKLGTRKLPTAELLLHGTPAEPVAGLTGGVRAIAPMLNVTRTWNAVNAAAFLRRGVALARDYAGRRRAFGGLLSEKPLHQDTLAGIQAEAEAAFHLTFRTVELMGKVEAGEADDGERTLLRALTPVVKATTGKQAVAGASEVLEAFGGAGYVEDTGLPTLLRDSQVLAIWEGTTNVLALDLLRALGEAGEGVEPFAREVARAVAKVETGDKELGRERAAAEGAVARAGRWLAAAGREEVEAGARRLLLSLGRATALALLIEQAAWSWQIERDPRPAAAARRFAAHGVDLIEREGGFGEADARRLALDIA